MRDTGPSHCTHLMYVKVLPIAIELDDLISFTATSEDRCYSQVMSSSNAVPA